MKQKLIDAKTLAQAKVHERKLLKAVRDDFERGDTDGAKASVVRYLHSYHAKLIAVLNARAGMQFEARQPIGRKRIVAVASALNPWQTSKEKVLIHAIPKDGNFQSYRLVFDFEIENRSYQQLVRAVLAAQTMENPHQFSRVGRDKAIEFILEKYA
ncbi:MAG: hypothetical protein J0653_07155, partial [Deltaproteobacteria bacterium]|nr:hypothetical protein [Deltaproteobacteria bacterium]